MELDRRKQSDIGVCAALCLLISFNVEVPDGTAVGQIYEMLRPDIPYIPRNTLDSVTRNNFKAVGRALAGNDRLSGMTISCQSRQMGYDPDGLNAAVFSGGGMAAVIFRGTAPGEWNDNAVALSGICQTNTYYDYDSSANHTGARIEEEYVSAQQAQALNYFHRVARMMGWREENSIVVAGHSKGGNKSQLITIRSPLVKVCYSFCGQGFSPEALSQFRKQSGETVFETRRAKIFSFSNENDFVNVLGDRLALPGQVHFFKQNAIQSPIENHELGTMIGPDGNLNPAAPQGDLSLTSERLWHDAKTSPQRMAMAMTVMTLCEQYIGNGMPINGDYVSGEVLQQGGRAVLGIMVRLVAGALRDAGVGMLSEGDREKISMYYNAVIKPRADSVRTSFGAVLGRALSRLSIREQRSKEKMAEIVVHTGAQTPAFSIDTGAYQNAARRAQTLCDQLTAVREELAADTAHREHAQAIRVLESEQMRLERVKRYLNDTAQAFERGEASLCELAGFVLEGR